jgi:hypothetical protein
MKMPTKPLETVIYRELQILRAGKFLEVATPLFQELVNYGSNALIRSATSSVREENEDLAALNLYRHILELTDAFEVMIANACVAPTIPIVRSIFEALLGLEYILESNSTYVQRSLSWLAIYLQKRISLYESMISESPRGKEFLASLRKDKWIHNIPELPQDKVQDAIDNLKNLLNRAQFEDIVIEIEKMDGTPNWYQLFGGPANIQQLAYHLDRHSHYDFLYRQWSTVAHAQDFSHFLGVDSTGEGGIRGIRDVGQIQDISRFVASFFLEATRKILLEFRPGESFSTYYESEVRELFLQVNSRDDFFN